MFARLWSSQYRLAWILASIVIILLLGWFMTYSRPSLLPFLPQRGEIEPETRPVRIEEGASLAVYYSCGTCPKQESIPSGQVTGLTRQELEELFPHMEILLHSRNRVELLDPRDLCPQMKEHMTLILEDEGLMLRYGKPGHLGPRHPLADSLVSLDMPPLSHADRQQLLRGIVLESEEEIWSLIEGLGR